MNKSELLAAIKDKTGENAATTEAFFTAMWTSIEEALMKGEDVAIAGIGAFKVKDRAAKEGINPATKQKIQIPAKKVISFKAGKALDEKINK